MTLLTRVDCMRRLATGVPEEWPSRRETSKQNPAYRPAGIFLSCPSSTFVLPLDGGRHFETCPAWVGGRDVVRCRSTRSLFGHDEFPVEVPRRVPEDGQNDRQPDQERHRSDQQRKGDDQSP